MKLNNAELKNREVWEKAGFELPKFDREKVKANTIKTPKWVHFGVGNIFRAFQAALQQDLLDRGIEDTGIIAAEGFDYEIIDKMNRPHDDLSLLVTLKADGSIEKKVIGSIVESIKVDSNDEKEFSRLKEIFTNPSLEMVSFTITEKGYSLGYPDVKKDFENGPQKPQSYLGKLVALCYDRYLAGKLKLALVSMDNCSHNGTKLYEAVSAFAKEWASKGLVEKGFIDYVNDKSLLSFPWTMIDKITPRPDGSVKDMLKEVGFEDVDDIITSKNTYVAPFVNAEEVEYLVIEDEFPNGRPKLDKAGVIFTDRETVDKVEKMKVCTCLNPLHTSLAMFGCLLSYTKISEEMKDSDLKKLAEIIGYKEGLKVVVDPKIIDPEKFIDEVLNIRIPNPFMPDTPQRIATDTSQKLSIRFGETIKAYQKSTVLDVKDLKLIPLVLAGWCRYIMGVDDEGRQFTVSPDPLYEKISAKLSDIKLGDNRDFHTQLQPILSDETIFGVDLYKVGLGNTVEDYFKKLVAGKGAVRKTLQTALKDADKDVK